MKESPALPEEVRVERNETYWEAVLSGGLTQEQAPHLDSLAREIHSVLIEADLLYEEEDIREVITGLRGLAKWLENWDETHVLTCEDGCMT